MNNQSEIVILELNEDTLATVHGGNDQQDLIDFIERFRRYQDDMLRYQDPSSTF